MNFACHALAAAIGLLLLAQAPDGAERAVRRAMGLLRAGEAREAERALESFVESNGSEASAWFALGECRRDLLDYDGSLEALRRAREIDPASVEYALALGNMHFVRLEKDLAVEQYDAVLRLDPANPHAAENRDTILRDRDRLDALSGRRRALLIALLAQTAAITAIVRLVFTRGRSIASGQSIGSRL